MSKTTPFVLTSRVNPSYPHDAVNASASVVTVSAIYDGAAIAAYKGSAVATSDVAQLVSIPAGSLVLNVAYKVITAEGATCTFSIGDGADVDGYGAAVNGNTTTDSCSFNCTSSPAFGVGKYYSAADTIDVLLASGTAAAVVLALSVTYINVAQAVTK